jgi:hypothetical protein
MKSSQSKLAHLRVRPSDRHERQRSASIAPRSRLNQEKRSMNSFLPLIFVFAVLGAIFLYGYLTDPNRPRATTIQPANGEANLRLGMSLQHTKTS